MRRARAIAVRGTLQDITEIHDEAGSRNARSDQRFNALLCAFIVCFFAFNMNDLNKCGRGLYDDDSGSAVKLEIRGRGTFLAR